MKFVLVVLSLSRIALRLTLLSFVMLIGVTIAGDAKYERVASIGGAITEIIYALGEESRIVAVDTTSVYPVLTEELTRVGYQRALSAEGLLAQQPDLLIATDAAGPSAVLRQISTAGVSLEIIPTDNSFDGLVNKIFTIASTLGVPEKGDRLVSSITEQMAFIQKEISTSDMPETKVVFLLSAGQGPLMAAGHSTAANSIISLAGATNPLSQFEGYKPVSAESLISASPDIILVTNRTYSSLGMNGVLAIPGLELTPAGRHKKIISMDGLLLLGFTPRLPTAIRELHEHIDS